MSQFFLQSRAWEMLQQGIGRDVWRIEDVLVIRHELPLGYFYIYCARPEFRDHTHAEKFLTSVQQATGREAVFLKIDLLEDLLKVDINLRATRALQPQKTVIADLTGAEDVLLASMHQKTRYNVRLAERKGVRVKKYAAPVGRPEREVFIQLLKETAARDGFHTHQREYYEALFNTNTDDFSNELFLAEYDGEMVAGAMVNFYSHSLKRATYLHGASSSTHRNVMAPQLLHWYIMQDAKDRGYKEYDFWGIDEERWPGVTRFKMGFGGKVISYPSSVDIVYRSFMYRAYNLIRRVV